MATREKKGKNSITLNGWDGGLNLDKDPSDIISDGESQDEAVSLTRVFADIPGKLKAGYPAIENSSSMAPSSPANEDDSSNIVAHNDKIYHHNGVYKFGDEVNWAYYPNYLTPTPEQGRWDDSNGWAETGDATKGQFSNSTHIEVSDGSIDNYKFPVFLSRTAQAGAADTVMCPSYNSITNTFDMTDDVFQGTSRMLTIISNDTNTNNVLDLGTDHWTLDKGYPVHFAGQDVAANWHAESGSGSSHKYLIKLGALSFDYDNVAGGGAATTADIGSMNHLQLLGSGNDNASPFISWRMGMSEETSGDIVEGIYGIYAPSIENRDIVLECQVGDTSSGYDSGGGSTGSGATNMLAKLNSLTIIASSNATDNPWNAINYRTGNTDNKIWRITKDELTANGCIDAKGKLVISYNNGIEGATFNPNQVRLIAIGLDFDDGNFDMGDSSNVIINAANTTTMLDLYEFSFEEKTSALGWGGRSYKFYSTFTNNGVESLPALLKGGNNNNVFTPVSKRISIEFLKPHTSHPYQEISKLYYEEADEDGVAVGEKFLLATIDRTNGIKKSGETTYADTWSSITPVVEFTAPPIDSTYLLESGYPEETEHINYAWQHSTTVGRQVYIGNVRKVIASITVRGDNQTEEDESNYANNEGIIATRTATNWTITESDASSDFDINLANYGFVDPSSSTPVLFVYHAGADSSNYPIGQQLTMSSLDTNASTNDRITVSGSLSTTGSPDDASTDITTVFQFSETNEGSKILKSPAGKIGGFSDAEYIDIDLQGENITDLQSAGDRLLVFSVNNLAIINVAQDIEFMEAQFTNYGVAKPQQVCKVGEGVAFVNTNGVYLFDGKSIISLSQEKMSSVTWDNGTNRPCVSYDERTKLLWVWVYDGSSGYDVYYFGMKTKSWVGKRLYSDIGAIQPITNSVSGKDQKTYYCIAGSSNQIKNIKSTDGSTAGVIKFETGEINLGSLAATKKFYKLIIQIANAQNIKAYWKTDVSGSYDAGTSLSSGVNELNITGSTAKGKWIQLKIETTGGSTTNTTCEIEDISVIYRQLGVR